MADEKKGQTATKGEWVAAAVGAVVILATVGYLGYEGITESGVGTPDLIVEVDSVVPRQRGWAAIIEVRNVGSATAASVRIVGELLADTAVVETSETTLDYVPETSSRGGALLFTRDPAGFDLEVRPTGYERP